MGNIFGVLTLRRYIEFCIGNMGRSQSKHDRYLCEFLVGAFQESYPRSERLFAGRSRDAHGQHGSVFLFVDAWRNLENLRLLLLKHRPLEHV